ncbi:MAG: aspartate carbamoyltransferase [Thermoplasmata archaeon]
MSQGFEGRDVISIHDFSRKEIEHVLDISKKMIPTAKGEVQDFSLKGKILSPIFFEPSTRTRLSFETAMNRLGGSIVGFSDPEITSLKKGETLADTMRMLESYSDVIVLRHPMEGAAKLAADFTEKPVINAGDGAGQHPTQTLLDLFTIWMEKGAIGEKNVILVGDLKYGRTVHSLACALAKFGANLTFVAPEILQMPKEIIEYVQEQGVSFSQSDNLEKAIESADVLYVTRIQGERFPDPAEYQKVVGTYRVDNELLKGAGKDIIIMHPLPRVDEIHPDVDGTPHAVYFKQAFNGVPVRMALLALILGVVK